MSATDVQTEQSTATRLYMEGGQYVRVSETVGQAGMLLTEAEHDDGWAHFEDPGTGGAKLVRASRVLWIEEEDDV